MRLLPRLVRTLATLALALPGTAAAQSFEVSPGSPTAADGIAIAVRYTSPCPGDGGKVEVQGSEIALLATENCGCSPFAHYENLETLLAGPLPAGEYTVNLYAAANQEQPGCAFEPRLIAATSLTVGAAGIEVTTDPEDPVAGSPLALVVRDRCPLRYAGPAVDGRVLRVLGAEDPLGGSPPCTATPSFESRLPVGPLAAGTYSALVLKETLVGPALAAAASFEVGAAEGEALLLLDGRFRVTATWRLGSGETGPATGLALTDQSGALWFFRRSNLELLVKILPGCDLNDHFWVLASGLTNVGVELRVEDLATGATKTYLNPVDHAYEPVLDTAALPCP